MDSAGNLYGTTSVGGNLACPIKYGSSGCGTVFKLNKNGKLTALYRSQLPPDGRTPLAGLVRDGAGNLYGTTAYGGNQSEGTIFRLDKMGRETVLYGFKHSTSDGANPGSLILDVSGNLIGHQGWKVAAAE